MSGMPTEPRERLATLLHEKRIGCDEPLMFPKRDATLHRMDADRLIAAGVTLDRERGLPATPASPPPGPSNPDEPCGRCGTWRRFHGQGEVQGPEYSRDHLWVADGASGDSAGPDTPSSCLWPKWGCELARRALAEAPTSADSERPLDAVALRTALERLVVESLPHLGIRHGAIQAAYAALPEYTDADSEALLAALSPSPSNPAGKRP